MKLLTVFCLSMFGATLMAAEELPLTPPENAVAPNAGGEDNVSLWDTPDPSNHNPGLALTGNAAIRLEYNPLVHDDGAGAGGSRKTTEFSFMEAYDGVSAWESLKLSSGRRTFDFGHSHPSNFHFATDYRF